MTQYLVFFERFPYPSTASVVGGRRALTQSIALPRDLDGGRGPGQFFGVHNLATDSKANLYATETYTGARVQRFVYRGVGPVAKAEQGVVRPKAR